MRIIKDATAKEYTCLKCNSILEVKEADIWHVKHEYDGHIINCDYYICPCCGERNTVHIEEYEQNNQHK